MILPQDEVEKRALIAELCQTGVKCTPEKIVCIGRTVSGKIVFLEEGKSRGDSGLAHILEEHKTDFLRRGIYPEQIPGLIISAITRGQFLGYQGRKEPRREVYEVIFNGQVQYVAVSISDNGYIVGANPAARL